MRTTIELPDALFREVKAKTGRDGLTLKEFFTEAARDKLRAKPESESMRKRVKLPLISDNRIQGFQLMTNAEIDALLDEETLTRR